MFAGFNLEIDNDYSLYYDYGKTRFDMDRCKIKEELDSFICNNGSLDGKKIEEVWFPQINADIFISHSHRDQRKAMELAGWLFYKFGLDVFIDSCVWGYAGDLLKMIDDKFCLNEDKKTYNYLKRNYSTSHVHMILSTALSKMIDKTECLFFLNTPNSINTSDIVDQTESPWIYSELAMTKIVRNKKLKEYRDGKIKKYEKKSLNEAQNMTINYEVSIEHLKELKYDDLECWSKKFKQEEYPLDGLYKIKSLLL